MWTPEQEKIAHDAIGTSDSIDYLADQLDLDITEVEEFMLDFNIEECAECGCWTESSDLLNDDDEVDSCSGCRQYHYKEDDE